MADLNVTPPRPGDGGPRLGDLFRELAQDSATLVRQEVALAKADLTSSAKSAARKALMVGLGGILALFGAFVLLASLVVAAGDALDNYWLGALIVGAMLVMVGGLLTVKNFNKLRHGDVAPLRTLETLREHVGWIDTRLFALPGDDTTDGYPRPKPRGK